MIRSILDKNGSAWPIARERERERIKKEKKKKGLPPVHPDSLSVSVKTKRRGATLSLVKIYGSFHTDYNGFRSTRLYRSWNPGGRNERSMFTIIIRSRSPAWNHATKTKMSFDRNFEKIVEKSSSFENFRSPGTWKRVGFVLSFRFG